MFYYESERNIQRVKKCAESCGVVGTKLLQFLTMHDGIVSPKNRVYFQDVYENCTPHSWEYTARIYKEQYGRDIEQDFDMDGGDDDATVPVGSGSIGQVYKLYHRTLEKHVAVKVKHPLAVHTATRFVSNVTFLLNIIDRLWPLPFAMLIREFITNIYNQLDYNNEAQNTQRLGAYFADQPNIVIPTVYSVRPDIIIMSHHDGKAFTDITCPVLRKKASFHLYLFMLSSFISYDFLHCDMHYGNFKICEGDNNDIKLIVYDCGIIGSTGNPAVNKDIILSTSAGDYVRVAEVVANPPLREQKRGAEMVAYCERVMEESGDGVNVDNSAVLADIIKQLFLHNIKMDTNILRSLQGLIICMQILAICTNTFTKIIGSQRRSREVLIVYNHAMLQKLGIHRDLMLAFEKWFEDEPTMVPIFYEWLDDAHGHRDLDIFIETMMKLQFIR